jgi:hypothetical protein
VSPLQLQGPKSRDILRACFGDAPTELKYYHFMEYDSHGVPLAGHGSRHIMNLSMCCMPKHYNAYRVYVF